MRGCPRLRGETAVVLRKLATLGDGGRCSSTSCRVTVPSSSGRNLEFRCGHIARMASGAVVVSHGESALLATVVRGNKTSRSSFVPLVVDFKQSASAIGRIPMNYLRRELAQTDSDVIASRLIDRSVRPLISKDFPYELQILCKPMALDDDGDGVLLAVNGASAALAVSDIPWNGPLAAVRVALINNKVVVNPSRAEMKESSLDLLVSGCDNGNKVLMIDMDGAQIDGAKFEECLSTALSSIASISSTIAELSTKAGKPKLPLEEEEEENVELAEKVESVCKERLFYVLTDARHDKMSRDRAIRDVGDDVVHTCSDDNNNSTEVRSVFYNVVRKILRDLICDSDLRCDGRGLKDFRPISMEVDVYKKLHGSALFQRGQTQVMGTVTFDAPSAAFHPDSISQILGMQRRKMFMLHYEFPPFAVNEISSQRGANRRELGHGALAEKALKHVIPENFSYSVRLACQVLESNGSSSMASVCAGSLALLDAGVPLKAPAAGLAIGLVANEDLSKCKLLTDILGMEDYYGDMDFKIAGTENGFTAMQLDLKLPGLAKELVLEAVARGRAGLNHILNLMKQKLPSPRSEFKSSVPVVENMQLLPTSRRILFRSAAYNAKLIEAETGAKISVEDEGTISIYAPDKERLEEAKKMMSEMFGEEEVELTFGAIYKAEIVEILEYGVMVSLKKGMRPILLKNSNLDTRPVAHASALGLDVGSTITVQYLGRDTATGQHRISRKLLQSASFPTVNLNRR